MRQNHGKCMQTASPKLVNSKRTISINLSKEQIFSELRNKLSYINSVKWHVCLNAHIVEDKDDSKFKCGRQWGGYRHLKNLEI